MARFLVILPLFLFVVSCMPVPLSFVDIRKQINLGFVTEDAVSKEENVSFTLDEPGIYFQPTLKISGQNKNVKMALKAVSNEEMSLSVSVETIKLRSYEGIFPPFIPLFPYMKETMIPSRRDENLKVRIFYSSQEPKDNYHFTDLYVQDGIKKIYPLEKFYLNVPKGKKTCEQLAIEFPITNREAEGKILHLDTIRSDNQTFSPVSGELKLYKSWNKEWVFFGGFICINC